MIRHFVLALALVFGAMMLSGCATRYQPRGLTGGYSDVQLGHNTFRVEFRGNGRTSREAVETYLLYRCAELTAQAGYDYFVVLNTDTEVRRDADTGPGTYTSTTRGYYGSATTTGTYYPGFTFYTTRYGGTAMMKAYRGKKPPDDPSAYDAREIMYYVGPRLRL